MHMPAWVSARDHLHPICHTCTHTLTCMYICTCTGTQTTLHTCMAHQFTKARQASLAKSQKMFACWIRKNGSHKNSDFVLKKPKVLRSHFLLCLAPSQLWPFVVPFHPVYFHNSALLRGAPGLLQDASHHRLPEQLSLEGSSWIFLGCSFGP